MPSACCVYVDPLADRSHGLFSFVLTGLNFPSLAPCANYSQTRMQHAASHARPARNAAPFAFPVFRVFVFLFFLFFLLFFFFFPYTASAQKQSESQLIGEKRKQSRPAIQFQTHSTALPGQASERVKGMNNSASRLH